MKVRGYIWIIAVFLTTCVDPISFEAETGQSQLVFFGNFSQLNQDHYFTITRTSDFDKIAIPVDGAQVTLWDDQGNSADYEASGEGKYTLRAETINGVPGNSYHIEITLSTGASYRSDPQIMPEPVELENLYFDIDRRDVLSSSNIPVEKTFVDIYVDTPLKNICGEPSHLRWTAEEVYSFVDRSCGTFDIAKTCYFIDPVDESEILLFENEGSTQEFLEQLKVRSRQLVPFDEFTARHYFIIRQFSISEDELMYWKKIDAVANQTGSLFDVQPARVIGNIYTATNTEEFALGYFGVNGESLSRIFITPFDIRPNPVFTCMDQSFFSMNPSICCFCDLIEGIQIERPAYWDED